MGNGHGRLRGANALADHRSPKERSARQVRQLEARETEAIMEAELAAAEEATNAAELAADHESDFSDR